MKENHKITEMNLDEWLRSTGFLPPLTEIELLRFDSLIEGYDFILKDVTIDPFEIIAGKSCAINIKSRTTINSELQHDIDTLSMAARKGSENIPQHIIDRMKKKHKKDDKQE